MRKQMNRVLSILLTLVMLVGVLPAPAKAVTAITPVTPAGSGTAADPYRIGTAAELYGFAAIVDGEDDNSITDGNKKAHAILTADITVNENVLDPYGYNNGLDFIAWDPIDLYQGVFDGKGHTISGLFIFYTDDNRYDNCGFFDQLEGVVRDLTVSDSYFRVSYGADTGNRYVGAICAELNAGTVWQCSFDGTIDADQGSGNGIFIGGIAGSNARGVIKECSVSGNVYGISYGDGYGVGGIVGRLGGGSVTGCINRAFVKNLATPKANSASTGGIAGHITYDGTITDSCNDGRIQGCGYVGGVAGSARGGNIQRCWNTGWIENKNLRVSEPVVGTYAYLGGILGHAGGTAAKNVIKNCYNHGSIQPGKSTGDSDPGPYIGAGIVGGYDDKYAASLSISYCYSFNTYFGDNLPATKTHNPIVTTDKGSISNCYYKIENYETGELDAVENTFAYQEAYFADGTVTALLNDQGDEGIWEQGYGNPAAPVLTARPEIEAERLEITVHPDKQEYTAGESFDPTGMLVQMHYTDGSLLPVTGYTVIGGECLLNTMHAVTISYTEDGVTYQTDEPITVTGENPTFTVTVGLGGSGGGTFEVGSRVTVTATVPTGAQFLGWSGLQNVKISIGSVTSTTVTFFMPARDVTATPYFGAVRSIVVTTPPDKTVYYAGEDFDPTGMVVTANCLSVPDGGKFSIPVTNYTVSGGSPLLEGQTKVTIRYRTGDRITDYVSTTQAVTVKALPKLVVNNGSGDGTYLPGTPVTATADVTGEQIFWAWSGLEEDFEIIEGSAFTPSVTFAMPDRDVTLEAVLEPIELEHPAGNGTISNPFEISTMGELYWFQRFVNGLLTPQDTTGITVEPSAACAKVVQDITVNADLLEADGTPAQSSGLARWTPIGTDVLYTGTFDGQNHTISGIYYDSQSAVSASYAGLFGMLGTGGSIRDLTLEDSCFCAAVGIEAAYTGGIAGCISSGGTVENCHFNGTVTTADTEGSDNLAGIAAVNRGLIKDCTSKGLISGYGIAVGGIAGHVYQDNSGGEVIGCVNEATVETTMTLDDSQQFASGGIAGSCVYGTIKDCCNKGELRSVWQVGGIVGTMEGSGASVLRCWNEGRIERGYGAGIVSRLGNYAAVQNCYNAGTVSYAGIVAQFQQGYNSITYCHNVGEILSGGNPICSAVGTETTVENCFYVDAANSGDDKSTGGDDGVVGTYGMSSTLFGPQFAAVCQLLNSGSNAGNWVQGDSYPVLSAKAPVSITGSVTVSGTSAVAYVTVNNLSGTEALLVIAQYTGGQMTAVKTVPVAADGTLSPATAFAHGEACTYQAFLLDARRNTPLCAAALLAK